MNEKKSKTDALKETPYQLECVHQLRKISLVFFFI